MKRTPADIYATARAAGLNSAQAIIATAIALAESGGDDTNIGDVSLQNGTWGPSVGLWQVRTLKAETGSGSDRDIQALQGNPARQARAMFNISEQGKNWSPWTVYTKGIYTKFMGQATAAMTGGTPINTVTPPGGLVNVGMASDAVSSAIEPVKAILIKLAFSGLGLALIGAGLIVAMKPQIKQAVHEANKHTKEQIEGSAKIAASVVGV